MINVIKEGDREMGHAQSWSRHYALGDHELVIHRFANGGLMIEIDPATPYYRMVEADPIQARRIRKFVAMVAPYAEAK